jgi:hypothetical protein
LKLRRMKTPGNARRLFLASLVYLPLLMFVLVLTGRRPSASVSPAVADAKAAEISVTATSALLR